MPILFVVCVGLLFCIDGIPAFAANTLSLKPAELVNLSLPPAVRSKIENMLLLMLLPSSMKGEDAKKYYDFASTYELQDMYTNGSYVVSIAWATGSPFIPNSITGVDGIKVKVFGTSMDTPGRSELLGESKLWHYYLLVDQDTQ